MSTANLFTQANPFRRVLATSTTNNAAFAARADVTTAPAALGVDSAAGYIAFASPEAGNVSFSPNTIQLMFFGAGANNTTGNCRVHGVRPVLTANGQTNYVHVLLAEYAFTLSAAVGVSGGAVSGTERYADTITRTFGNDNVSDQMLSPANDTPGHVLVDVKGCSMALIELAVGTATNVNALWAGV